MALAASAGLHLAAIALLPERAPVSAPRPERLAVELRPGAPRPAPGFSRPAAARPARGTRHGGASRGETSAVARPREDAPPGGPLADPREGLGVAPSASADLRARPPPPSAGAEGEARASDADGALAVWTREQAGRARAESGAVHPYVLDVGRRLARAWDVERAMRRGGLARYLAQAGGNVRDFGRVWQRMARGFAATGSPGVIDGGSERIAELSGLPAGPARDALVAAEVERQLRPAFSEGHVALVRVTQAAAGALLSVELARPSRDPEMDRAAVEAARAAARDLPAPPPEALANAARLVSLWEFEVEVSIAPPVPVVGLEFDEVLGLGDLRLPLSRRAWKRVRLAAVYWGGTPADSRGGRPRPAGRA